MNQEKFIDIGNKEKIKALLCTLSEQAMPRWGTLTPLGMIEHLVETVEYTNGKKQASCELTFEQAQKRKAAMIYSDAEMPMGVKTPLKKDDPVPSVFNNLQEATNALIIELDAFEKHFETPGITAVHPGFGSLQYQEWRIFHGKHFTHHLKQFGLIS